MPQLDTSTWFMTILSMIITLFVIMQLKVSTHNYPSNPETKTAKTIKSLTPWDTKWTKIFSPLSLPLRS